LATCADLVAAVTAIRDSLNTTDPKADNAEVNVAKILLQIRDLLSIEVTTQPDPEQPPVTKTIAIGESAHRTSNSLEQRLPHRQMWTQMFNQLLLQLQYQSDSIAERIAQQTAYDIGSTAVPSSGITDTPDFDQSLDIDNIEKG